MITSYKIFESKQLGLLYHWTEIDSLEKILKDDKMWSGMNYISFSRNKKLNYKKRPVKITFDGKKMSDEFKFESHLYQNNIRYKDEAEERIECNEYSEPNASGMEDMISGVKKYIINIEIEFFDDLYTYNNFHYNKDFDIEKTLIKLQKLSPVKIKTDMDKIKKSGLWEMGKTSDLFKESTKPIYMMSVIGKEYAEVDFDDANRQAFGFAEPDIKKIHPKLLNIKWKDDYENAIYQQEKSGLSKIEWSKTVNLTEPIQLSYKNGKFFIEDGHHRYLAAKILNKELNVDDIDIQDKAHLTAVKKALSQGKKVPYEVLKDYPELMKKTENMIINYKIFKESKLNTPIISFFKDKEMIGTAEITPNGDFLANCIRYGSEFSDDSRGGTWYEIPAYVGAKSGYQSGWWGSREGNMGVGGKNQHEKIIILKNPYFVDWGGYGEAKIVLKIAKDVIGEEKTNKLKKGITGINAEKSFAKLEFEISKELQNKGYDGIVIYDFFEKSKMIHPKQIFVFNI